MSARKVIPGLILSALVLIAVVILFSIVRDRREDTQNINLNLPPGRTNVNEILHYTKECTATTRPRDTFPIGIIGISMNAPPIDETYFHLANELGVTWMRAQFNWRDIELPDGTYNWKESDVLVDGLRAHGFQILANISLLPTHIHTWEDMEVRFRKFTRAFSERYTEKGVIYYEIFNEPNLPGWGWLDRVTAPEGYVGEYAVLLAAANQEIHGVNPSAVIVSGGISSDDVAGMPYPVFIQRLLTYGGRNCFDIFAFHPYGHEGKFMKTTTQLGKLLGDTQSTTTPIWFNEYGTDKDSQLIYSIESLRKERNAASAWFWFTLRDLRPNHRWNYGLTDYFYEKKDAFNEFKRLLKG